MRAGTAPRPAAPGGQAEPAHTAIDHLAPAERRCRMVHVDHWLAMRRQRQRMIQEHKRLRNSAELTTELQAVHEAVPSSQIRAARLLGQVMRD